MEITKVFFHTSLKKSVKEIFPKEITKEFVLKSSFHKIFFGESKFLVFPQRHLMFRNSDFLTNFRYGVSCLAQVTQ